MPNGVDTELFSPGDDAAGLRERLGIPAGGASSRVRRDARPRAPLQAPRRRDRRGRPLADEPRAPGRRRRRRAARAVPRARAPRRRGRRARPLPRRRSPRRAARGPARERPVPADHRAAGVVRDRPDRGDGLRAAGDRHRLPRRARRGRRRARTGSSSRAATPAAVAAAIRRTRPDGAEERRRWERPGAPRRIAEWSWPRPARPHGRRLRARRSWRGARRSGVNLLLVAYFYPPCRDTGARAPATMAKYLRRLGHRVTVLTTSAYGEGVGRRGRRRAHPRPPARPRAPARPGPHRRAVRLRHLLGAPAPALRGPRPGAAGRRVDAVRPLDGAAPAPRREAFDCRDHDLAAGVGPPRRPRARAARRALGRRLRDAWNFESAAPAVPDRAAAPPRRAARARAGSAAADAVVCVSQPAADDLRERLGISAPR